MGTATLTQLVTCKRHELHCVKKIRPSFTSFSNICTSENVPWLIEVYSEGYDSRLFMHDFESQGMFVINSEIIPVAYEIGLSVLRLDPTTGAHETMVSIFRHNRYEVVRDLQRQSMSP